MQKFFIALIVLFFLAPVALPVRAQQEDGSAAQEDAVVESQQVYARGKVLEILEDVPGDGSPLDNAEETVSVRVTKGESKGEILHVTYTFASANYRDFHLEVGDTVVLGKVIDANGENYYVLDTYRLSTIIIYLLLFALAAIIFGRSQGAGSLVGLGVSLAVLMLFMVPRIIAGNDPLLISFIGSAIIAVVSVLLAHGFKRRTYVALVATLVALLAAFVLAILAAKFAGLSGTGTEEALFLQLNYLPQLDLRGLLLGGIVIGTLGVLDDVTTAQVAAIEEISLANPMLGVGELYKRGISVGREHIAALVNTLILAYAGASFPLFLLFALPDHPPLWVILNNENIVEEVLRALVGGTTLMLAVPISTALAAAVFGSLPKSEHPQVRRSAHTH